MGRQRHVGEGQLGGEMPWLAPGQVEEGDEVFRMPLGGLLLPPGCPPPRPLPPSTYPSGDETEAKMTPNPQASTIVGPRSAGTQQAGLVSASTLCSAGHPTPVFFWGPQAWLLRDTGSSPGLGGL